MSNGTSKQLFEGNMGNLAHLHAKGARGRKERKIPHHSRTLHVIGFDEMNKKQQFSHHYYALWGVQHVDRWFAVTWGDLHSCVSPDIIQINK